MTFLSFGAIAQDMQYEVSAEYPYGRKNPEAPQNLEDFGKIVGKHECKSISRLDPNTWTDTIAMTWVFKYIMNGNAIQDETYKADGLYSGSIRQYNTDSAEWYVHYYSNQYATATLGSWAGEKKENGDIILYKDQTAPNGMEGFYKITFSDMSEKGFNWLGEWVNPDESIHYPTWRIQCKRTDER